MENASKALIIVATTILAILLFYIMIYMFRAGARVDEQYEENQAQRQLELANSQFELYNTPYNTIMDLITVCNLAYSKNVESDYDNGRAVNIIIRLGNSDAYKFEIPSDKGKIAKNEILFKGSQISIYNLVDTKIKDLEFSGTVSGIDKEDKLSKTHAGIITYGYDKYGAELKDEVTEYVTVYKYLFKCEKIEYHQRTGLVKSMEFKLNTEIPDNSPLTWDSSWD